MFILGLAAFFQTIIIPGYLLLKYNVAGLGSLIGINDDLKDNPVGSVSSVAKNHFVDENGEKEKKGTGKKSRTAGIYYGDKRHQAASLIVSRCGKNGTVKKMGLMGWVYGFGLSLLFNYLMVFGLTAVGLYKPAALYLLFIIEMVLLLNYWVKQGIFRSGGLVTLDFGKIIQSVRVFFADRSFPYQLFFLFSIVVLAWYVFLFLYFFGSVFGHWDPVVGWNRFAVDWSANHFPNHTWRYPQLIPSNWSISYVMMQTTNIQFFAKSIMGLFSIGILLIFLDIALLTKRAVYLAGLIIFGGLLVYLYHPSYITSGYVDIAVAFFAFLSFYTMLSFSNKSFWRSRNLFTKRFLVYSILFASAAGVTKQSGLFVLGIIWVWCIFSLFKNRGAVSFKQVVSFVVIAVLITGIITGVWYVMKEIEIRRGLDRSEIQVVQRVLPNHNLIDRFSGGINYLSTLWHPRLKPVVLLGFVVMLLGLFHKKSWAVTLFMTIPQLIGWGFFFSYDQRNLAPATPFIAYSASFGAVFLKQWVWDKGKLRGIKFKFRLLPFLIVILALAVVATFTVFKGSTLVNHQVQRMKNMGDWELNRLLYEYQKKEGFTGKIVTNYQFLKYLPGLGHYYKYEGGRISQNLLAFLDSEKGKEVHYLLMPKVMKQERVIYKEIWERLDNKIYRLIFKLTGYYFIKVR